MFPEATPIWNPADKPASLLAWGEWLHAEAQGVFLKDGSHGQMLFLFSDDGIASINPIPPGTSPERLTAGVRQAVKEHNLYGVITVAEAWTYFPKDDRDHTSFQLLDGEMNVADLSDGDKTEALMVRLESRDGQHVTWLDRIARVGGRVTLGAGMRVPREKCLKLRSYFEQD
ncbi:MAG: hypothetical protein FJ224_08495 [Lentisphaerae bacterium]|nr:hypothetical protein [Lentisphaerota bacterium]